MIYILIGIILIFDYSLFRISAKCSRIEEKLEDSKRI